MTDRKKLIELLRDAFCGRPLHGGYSYLADYLIAHGVTFATDNNVGDKLSPAANKMKATADKVAANEIDFDYDAED